ncbi:hypothetical protein FQR65_LT08418 [Abscondita terminalis]|nr:hypothetical protein FQR65_LT08418 [Abscondita terminalis]
MTQMNPLRNTDISSLLFNEYLNESKKNKRFVTLKEVSFHDSSSDCWVVIYDRVYDVTKFLNEHPGGRDILLEYGGRDASWAFRSSGHSKSALYALKLYYVGELPEEERIFRKIGGYAVLDLP